MERTGAQQKEKTPKKPQQINLAIMQEEINKKNIGKKGRLQRYHDRFKQYKQNMKFENDNKKFY